MVEKLILGHGNWVDGERFWDRKKDLELFIARIDEGANQLLVAPRRMGKTSLLHETARRLGKQYLCLFVDLEKSFDAADAIAELGSVSGIREVFIGFQKHLYAQRAVA